MPTKTVIEQLIIEIAGDSKKFKATVKELKKQNKDLEGSYKKLGTVAKGTFAAIGAAAVTLGVVATKAFADFETGVTNVAKTTNLAGKDLEDFKDEIISMSERIPVTTDKLLEIATAAGQLGIKGTANLSKFTETIAKLGATTDLEGEQAALAIARILNLTNESISSVDLLGSTLVDLGNNFAASESEILEVAKDVAKATVQFGLASDEILGISASMASLGIAAEAGGTVVGKAFASIDAAIREQGGPAFEKLVELTGMTGDQLTQTFATDAPLVFQKFIEGLGRAGAEGKDMTAELGEMNLSGIRVNKILPTLASRSDILAEAMKRAGDASKDASALNAEAATAFETNSSKWQIAQNKIDNALIGLGEEIAPQVTEAITEISNAIADNKEAIGILASGIKGAITIIGGALKIIGKVFSAAKKVIDLKIESQKKWKKEQKDMIKNLKYVDSWVKKSAKSDKEYTDGWVKNAKTRTATNEQYVDTWLVKEDERKEKAEETDAAVVQSAEDAAKKRNAAIEAEAMKRAEIEAEADADEFERIGDFTSDVVAEIEKREAEKLKKIEDKLSEEDKLYRKYHNGQLLSETEFGKKMTELKEIQASSEYGAIKNGADAVAMLINSENNELKTLGKAATIVQITMSTIEAAMKAYNSLAWIPYVGVGLGAIAAAGVAAYGAERVSKVQAMKTGGIVPGTGDGDIVPAMLEPGELVVPKDEVAGVIAMMGARRMREGGVAGQKEKTGLYDTFADIFKVPGIFKALLGMEDKSDTNASGFGSSAFSGMVDKMANPLDEAADELLRTYLTAVPGGDILYEAIRATNKTEEEIKKLLGDNALTDILDQFDLSDEIEDAIEQAGGAIIETGKDVAGGAIGIIEGGIRGAGGAVTGAIGTVLGFQKGGIVPGNGSGDIVPALLEPGEVVIPNGFASSIGGLRSRSMSRPSITGSRNAGSNGSGERTIRVINEIGIQDDFIDYITVKQREKQELGT